MKSPLLIAAACLLLVSCSEPPVPKEPEKPPEPVTGRHALQQMFIAARTWAQDLADRQHDQHALYAGPGCSGQSGRMAGHLRLAEPAAVPHLHLGGCGDQHVHP